MPGHHLRTATPTACGRRTPTARPKHGQPRGGRAPNLRRPSQRREATLPWAPPRHPRSAQCRLTKARAVGPVLGPHTHTTHARETRATHVCNVDYHARTATPTTRGQRTPDTRPTDGRAQGGKCLAPDAPHNSARHPPRGRAPATPTARRSARCGTSAGSHAHTTRAQETGGTDPGYPPEGRAAGGGRAPGPRRPSQTAQGKPPGDGLPPAPQHAGAQGVGPLLGPHAHTNRARETRATRPGWPPQGRAAGGGTAPDTTCPSQRRDVLPPEIPSAGPASRKFPQGTPAKRAVPGPHARICAPKARGQRTPTPTTRLKRRQPGEDDRLASGAPHNSAGNPPRGRPPAGHTASRRARCGAGARSPHPQQPRPGRTGNRAWLTASSRVGRRRESA